MVEGLTPTSAAIWYSGLESITKSVCIASIKWERLSLLIMASK